MPLPAFDRLDEYARKGLELLLRAVDQGPEQRVGRRLRAQHHEAPGTGPRVLFVNPRDWAEHVSYQAVMAHALQLRGASVHMLTCGGGLEVCDRANTYEAPPMPCRSCARFVEHSMDAHGFHHTSMRQYWAPGDEGGWPELDERSRDELADVRDGDVALGRLIDIPLKWFLCAADLDDDPLAGVTSRAFLRSARRIARGIERALDDIEPDIIVLLNGLFLFEGIAWALAERRGIDVVTYERAFLKETLVFSRETPAGFYDFSADWAKAARPLTDGENTELDDYLARRRQGGAFDQFWEFRERAVDRGTGRLAVLFTNLTWDTAVIGRDAAFPGIRAWVDTVIEAFAARPEHRLVIRVHPSELHLPGKRTRDGLEAYIRSRFETLPPNVEIVSADDLTSSYPLMDHADVGLVYTSTTGLELALSGTPVIVAGATHYRDKGFTLDADDAEEFLDQLDAVLADPARFAPDVDRARQYAHFFFFRAPIAAPAVVEPVPGLARITTDDLDDLRPGANAALDRICDGILLGTSFIPS
jgi:hypothetical protein